MSIPRFARFEGYETLDMKEFLSEGRIEFHLRRETGKSFDCFRCGKALEGKRGKYRLRLEGLPIMGHRTFIHLWRHQGYCKQCKKARAERIEFIAEETPHLTQDYAWFFGKLCEVAAVSRVAQMFKQGERTIWEVDYRRMKRMLGKYKIPKVTQISVDEVYARKHSKYPDEGRNRKFFTVITDLKTRKVIWVSESRDKEALDSFFILLGEEACQSIKVIAMDQHEDYRASVKEYCPQATIVWDKFHLLQNFEKAVNDMRMQLHEEQVKGTELKRLTRGKFRFVFLKKAHHRTEREKTHIESVVRENTQFAKLEIIKERVISLFYEKDAHSAQKAFEEIGDWIWQAGFGHLMNWYRRIEAEWVTVKNYFTYRVTTSVSEGINNVIKSIKRRGFGYKNMHYFRLKIMQVCGYLNSQFIPTNNQLLT